MKRELLNFQKQSFKILFTVILIIGSSFINGGSLKSQVWQWAKNAGGPGNDGAQRSCVDGAGNIYVGGFFSGTSIQVGTISIPNAGSSDGYLAKYDPSGNVIWAQRIGGSLSENISGICVDPVSGNVYVTGSFSSPTIAVSPYTMGNANIAGGNYDGFIACFNTFGSCQWLAPFGGLGDQHAGDCAFSTSLSCLYVTGNYGTTTMSIGSNTLINTSASGKEDVFIARYTTGGLPVWAKTTGASNSDDYAYSVSVDASGYPYFGGTFAATMVFGTTVIGTTTLTSYGSQDMFLAKYSDVGVFQWAKGIGSNQSGDYFSNIKIDATNNVFISGYYYGAPLTLGTLTLANAGSYDAFVAKYNSAGTAIWANRIGGSDTDYGYDIALDGNSNVYFTGGFAGTVITVGAITLTNTTPGSLTDAFVAKYNSSGVPQWAINPVGAADEVGYGIAADAIGNVYATGSYNVGGPTAFGTTTLTSAGSYDVYFAKLGCLTASITGPSTICNGSSATLTANGATNYTWSSGPTTSSIVITPITTTTFVITGNTGSCTATSNIFNVNVLPANLFGGGNLNLLCGQSQTISASCSPPNPTSVVWSPTTGLSSSTILTPTVHATAPSTTYTLTVNLSNGCVLQNSVVVAGYAPTPDICMVTVDSVGTNNLILWDMSASPKVDTFFIWRDIANNNYKLIGRVPKTAAYGEFQDTVRSLYAANGDPNVAAWRYKISYKDSCGFSSALSPYHKTIFVQGSNGNFSWNDYQIEGQPIPVPALNNYVFRRDNLGNGVWQNIQTLSSVSTAYTDPNYSTYTLTANWRAETLWGVQCSSSYLRGPASLTVKRSKSNLNNNRPAAPNGLKENSIERNILIYPNPAKDLLNINGVNDSYDLTIENALGQIVFETKAIRGNTSIEVNKFAKGFYNLKIQTTKNSLNKKLIIE